MTGTSSRLRRGVQWASLAVIAMWCMSGLARSAPVAAQSGGLTVSIRRDASQGLPLGGSHNAGVSSIVSGIAPAGSTLSVTLTHPGAPAVVRSVVADSSGAFTVSMDRNIADGDTVSVSTGSTTRVIPVPILSYQAFVAQKMITGAGPANIGATQPGSPHSLQVSFGAAGARQVTTNAAGFFSADFSANPFQPATLGSLHYVTAAGDHIFKPLFTVDPFARGRSGDGWADVILGQPDFAQTTFNETVATALFNPNGVYVDRSSVPNRVYVYDAGNSRILGFRALGATAAGQPCTSEADFGAPCQIQPNRAPDIIIGQPAATTSTCNGDSAYQQYPDVPMASAATLCGMREEQMSLSEGGSGVTMAADAQGNLYVPDFFNNRVLRYDRPLETDAIADAVWGQADFQGIHCNRGASFGRPSAQSLCFASQPGIGDLFAGVAIDAAGSLWVADTANHRVLRFPFDPASAMPAPTADLVLGQTGFTSAASGSAMNAMAAPASVRVAANGTVFVADSLNNRVLVFPSPAIGASAARLLGSGITQPLGLEIDPEGGVWVDDIRNYRFLRFIDEVQVAAVPSLGSAWGGLGIDRDGDVMWAGWEKQQVQHFTRQPDGSYAHDTTFLTAEPNGIFNRTSARGLYGGQGIEVTDTQLIHSDYSRILFWNNPAGLANHQPADGVLGAPNFQTRSRYGPWYERMRAGGDTLWVVYGNFASPATLLGYALPLTNGAAASRTISSPLPLVGGGSFAWGPTVLLSGIAYQAACDCVWLSDEDNHRIFRIRNASTAPQVDIVLGQTSLAGVECNQGRGRSSPSADSLCHPGALSFDPAGNLFVSDHNTEFDGNLRLLAFDAASIPAAPPAAVFGIPASRVFGRNGSFTEPGCPDPAQDQLCAPWEAAFGPDGVMVLGFNGYFRKFPMIYQNILGNPQPVSAIADYQSMPMSARFDQAGNMYMVDHNRSRVLIYHGVYTPSQPPSGQSIHYLPLINADTEQPIAGFSPLVDGATLNLTTLPTRNLNVRADTLPATVGSVKFVLDGALFRLENSAPYAMAGNDGADYGAWTPSLGAHTLAVTPYTGSNGSGIAGTTTTISFTVIDQPAPSRAALLVVGNAAALNAGDSAVLARLQSPALGYSVTLKSASAAAAGDASGKDIVLISSSVSAVNVGGKFKAVAVPVVTWEYAIYDDMALTGPTSTADYGTTSSSSLVISNPGHPLAAGLSGSLNVFTAAAPIPYGLPLASAISLAPQGTSNSKKVYFAYEKNAGLYNSFTVSARRVGLFFADTATPTADGWKLFDAAVTWAAAP